MKPFLARAALALTLAVPLLLATPSEACGPDCSEPPPKDDLQACLAGKLGDLTQHSPECQAAGFLLMRGLAGADKELVASTLPQEDSYPGVYTGTWKEARAKVSAPPEGGEIATEASVGDIYFYNCLTGAFEVAAKTLDERIAKLGANHPEVLDWAKAQDVVFANCGRGPKVLPAPAPANASPAVRADRAYQTAAALFYAGEFDEAIRQLDAIAKDAASPWRGWARLVAVRAVIRQATLVAQTDEEKRALLEKARERCVAIVKEPALKDIHRQTRQLTWFIDYRLRPDKQLNLLGRVLLEKPDDNFGYAWRDYFGLRKAQQPPSTDELSSFLDALRSQEGSARALEWWKKTRSLPWLVAALGTATGKEPELPELLAQSATVPKDSPAYVSLHAARGRVALANGRFDEARAEFLPLLESGATTLPPLTVQRLAEGLRAAALTFEEWAKYAHLSASDAASFFSSGVPLARFKDAKMLEALDPKLRREVVLGGWARAALLDRWDEEKALEPQVEQVAPELKDALAKVKTREKPEERKMAAVLILLKSPGMSPHVSPYRTQGMADFDICSQNGWCGGEPTDFYKDCDASKGACGTRFISVAERREVLAERQALGKLGESPDLLIQFTLDYAKRHPDDALVPEALHQSVRQTRFAHGFCTSYEEGTKARSALSKQAFQLLQRKYGKTEWAKKTPYHF